MRVVVSTVSCCTTTIKLFVLAIDREEDLGSSKLDLLDDNKEKKSNKQERPGFGRARARRKTQMIPMLGL